MKRLIVFCLLLLTKIGSNANGLQELHNQGKPEKGLDTNQIVLIGGIKQYISIKGDKASNPILLFLHGAGSSVMNFADNFTSKLKKHFVVVQWDQRETNKTLKLNPSPVPLTVSLFQHDTKYLVDTLLKQFKRQKLFLVAHSWGSVLGFDIADKFPELLHAYVAVSPMVHQLESERMTLAMLKTKAEQQGNSRELTDLSSVRLPYENGKQLFFARKSLFKFNGQPVRERDTTAMIRYIEDWSSTWLPVWNEALNQNLIKDIPRISCPIYFFISKKDYQTHFKLADEYYNILTAPKKQLFWFDKAGHLIPNEQPDLFQEIIINKVLAENSSAL